MRSNWIAVVALLAITIWTRLPALLHPLAIDDEAVYSVVAHEILEGGKPYVDAVERKPPLLFYTYAAIFAVGGKYNWPALHIAALLWTLATMAGLCLIGRQLFDRRTGWVAALLYALFQPAVSFKNLQLNGELLMNLPIVLAWAIAFAREESRRRPLLFLAGVLSCLAFLLKQPAAIAAVPLGLYLLLPSYRQSRGLTTGDSISHFVIFAAGFWLTIAATAWWLAAHGILRDAIYWTIKDHATPQFFFARFVRSTAIFVAASLPLLIAAVAGRRCGWPLKRAEWLALVSFLAASAVGAAAGGRFYSHYYIQLLPPLVLLAAPAVAAVAPHPSFLNRAIACIWLALTIVVFPLLKWCELATRRTPTEAGLYLAEHHQPGDRLFVWGQVPKIYLEAQMRPACRYIATFPLTGYVFGGPIAGLDTRSRILPGAWENLEHDFARHPPAFIVDVQHASADYTADYRVSDFPILQNIVARDYVVAAQTAEGVIYQRELPRSGRADARPSDSRARSAQGSNRR